MDTTTMVVTGILVAAGIGFLYWKFGVGSPKPATLETEKPIEKPIERPVKSELQPSTEPLLTNSLLKRPLGSELPKPIVPPKLEASDPVNLVGCWKEIDGDSAFSFKKNGKCKICM